MSQSLTKRAASSKRVGELFIRAWRAVEPGERAWKGATLGLLVGALLIGLPFFYTGFLIRPRGVAFVVGSVASLIVIGIIAGLLALLVVLLKSIPTFYLWALAGAFMLLSLAFGPDTPGGTSAALAVIVVSSLLGGAVWVLVRGGWKDSSAAQRVMTAAGLLLGLAGLGAGVFWSVCDGPAVEPPPNAAAQSAVQVAPLAISDPSRPGVYEPQMLFYGSGVDRQRPEYGPSVELVTEAVDGSPFIDGWQRGSLRSNYWGFGPDELPLNAWVWYPAGAGPFPLVLMAHGNHEAEDFSDSGYDYLGQLLASRGFIFVSVDENFLNTSFSADLLGGGLKDEIDARAWLLLEHVRVWDEWNKTPGNPFYQVVDMDNIAVIGHSRGGAAAAVAAAFNQLPFYPDDATVAFDYHFGIRSVAAMAPVDAVYEPAVSYYRPGGRRLPLENVNYLALHGSSDMQVWSFVGLSQYERVTFTDDEYWFKATLYIYGANHSQFNTTWGRFDYREPKIKLFDQRSVMPAQEQKQIVQVYVS